MLKSQKILESEIKKAASEKEAKFIFLSPQSEE